MGIIRGLIKRWKFRRWYRLSKKLHSMSDEERRRWTKELWPGSESPLIGLTKAMDKEAPSNPRFKYFHSILGERKE